MSTKPFPLAYLITFSCYGKRLHGEGAETVDRRNNISGTPFFPATPLVAAIEEQQLAQPAYEMEAEQQAIVLRSIQEVCAYRMWRLWAAHVRSNHAHVVVSGQQAPEKIMNDFKAYATRALNRSSRNALGRKHWARHASSPTSANNVQVFKP